MRRKKCRERVRIRFRSVRTVQQRQLVVLLLKAEDVRLYVHILLNLILFTLEQPTQTSTPTPTPTPKVRESKHETREILDERNDTTEIQHWYRTYSVRYVRKSSTRKQERFTVRIRGGRCERFQGKRSRLGLSHHIFPLELHRPRTKSSWSPRKSRNRPTSFPQALKERGWNVQASKGLREENEALAKRQAAFQRSQTPRKVRTRSTKSSVWMPCFVFKFSSNVLKHEDTAASEHALIKCSRRCKSRFDGWWCWD